MMLFEPNWYLLGLIFAICLIAKLLKTRITTFSNWVVGVTVREPQALTQLRREVASMKEELQSISITESFAEHAKLKRKLIQKEGRLNTLEKEQRSNYLKASALAETVCTALILILRVGVVLVNRSTPVVVMSPESLWPLDRILSFPTGVPGAVGGPCWALMCMQSIGSAAHLCQRWINSIFARAKRSA